MATFIPNQQIPIPQERICMEIHDGQLIMNVPNRISDLIR
jgi:hypothetical protein